MRGPCCDSEVESGDPYCAMCGNRLSETQGLFRSTSRCLILAILAIIAIVCVGGGIILSLLARPGLPASTDSSPTPTRPSMPSLTSTPPAEPTAPSIWGTYTNGQLGIYLRYPEDWLVQEDASLRQVVFAAEQDDLQVEDFQSGTSFAVVVNPSSELGTETPDVVLDNVSGRLSSTYQHLQYGEVLSLSIDGAEGALMYVEGEFSRLGAPLRSWVAAVVAYEHVYVFAAAAPLENWPEYQPVFREMLEAVQLSEPTTPAPTLSPTPLRSTMPITPTPTSVPSTRPDAYEPDDRIADAAPIATDGLPQMHNLHIEGDHDYLCFEAAAGNAYTIETRDLAAEIDPIIYLYDSQGQELAHSDDGADEPLASRIIWLAPSSGLYYVMVRDLAEDSTGIATRYSLTVVESAFAEGADPYEPDDTPAEATRIGSDGTRQAHTFYTTTDVDFVSFAAQEGREYTIQTGNLQAACNTTIYLYNEAGVELDYDDDAGEDSFASLIVWTAPSTGVHYVKIRDFSGRAGPAVSYEVWISVQ